ncbi:MAG: hypothetical protein ACKVP5_23375 [Aestuariivirga sp.]
MDPQATKCHSTAIPMAIAVNEPRVATRKAGRASVAPRKGRARTTIAVGRITAIHEDQSQIQKAGESSMPFCQATAIWLA